MGGVLARQKGVGLGLPEGLLPSIMGDKPDIQHIAETIFGIKKGPPRNRSACEYRNLCLSESECRLRALMLKVQDETAAILDGMVLADPIAAVTKFAAEEWRRSASR